MPLVVTPGGEASDSYITLSDALAFAAADYGPDRDLWVAGSTTDDQRERALRRAARDLDDAVLDAGVAPYALAQARYWPRWTDLDDAGLPIVPAKVARAQYEQAKYVLQNADSIDRAAARRARQLDSFSEPNVSGTLARDPSFGLLAPKAEALLRGLSESGGGGATIARIVRT